jgi:uncharacterized membrane protein
MELFAEWEISHTVFIGNYNTQIMLYKLVLEMVPFMRQSGKIRQSETGHRWQYVCVIGRRKDVICIADDKASVLTQT